MKNVKRLLAVLAAATTLMTAYVMPVSAYTEGMNNLEDSYATDWPQDPFAMLNAKLEDCTVSYEAYDIDDFAVYAFAKLGYNAEDGDNFATIFTKTLKAYGRFNNGPDHAFMTFMKRNGEFEFIDAMMISSDEVVDDIGEIADDIRNSQKKRIIDMKVGRCKEAWSYFIYYRTDEGEYIVPVYNPYGVGMGYTITPYDFFENEKTYTVEEFLECINSYWNSGTSDDAAKYDKYVGIIIGDANDDNKVNIRDCAAIAGAIVKHTSDSLSIASDYNFDGVINVRDCAALASDLSTGNVKTYKS